MERLPDNAWAAAAQHGRTIGHRVEAHVAIGSTNDRARALLDVPGGPGTAVVAEQQLAGRGRRGRTWTSPPGRNLMVSVAVPVDLAAGDAWQLGCAVALAAHDACRTVAPVALKWPNDVVARDGRDGSVGRKVGGILVETTLEADRVTAVVAGIGVNVNWWRAEMPAELAPSATSLAELAGEPIDRVALLARLLGRLDAEIAAVAAGRSPLARYRAACGTVGTNVEVRTDGGVVAGRAIGLDDDGALLVAVGPTVRRVTNGDVGHVTVAADG